VPNSDSDKKRWLASLIALNAAQAADVATSYGQAEANPVMRSAGGRFGGRGAAIKAGTMAGLDLLQAKTPKHRKLWTILNLAAAPVVGYVAARNARRR